MSTTLWAQALVTEQQVKGYMAVRNASDDELIRVLINEVSADCQNRVCERMFLTATYTDEKYDGTGTDNLLLRQWPVTSVTSLVIVEGGSAIVEDTDFFVYNSEGRIRLKSGVIPLSVQQVVITYVAGYANQAALPFELVSSIKDAVAIRYRKVTKKGQGVSSQTITAGGSTHAIERAREKYSDYIIDIWNSYSRNHSS